MRDYSFLPLSNAVHFHGASHDEPLQDWPPNNDQNWTYNSTVVIYKIDKYICISNWQL